MAAACEDGICMLAFFNPLHIEAHLYKLKKTLSSDIASKENISYFNTLRVQLQEYFNGSRHIFDIPLKLVGTPFQIRVWKELLQIDYAKTISYKEEAMKIGNPKAYRAVANANGQNMLHILVPCHRVISHNGKLNGYGAGVDKKEFLINHEQNYSRLFCH